jgi:thiol-disulfide isomerase/thioredoxin
VQYATALTCSNCHIATDKLKEVADLYPAEVIYIKYHQNDLLGIPPRAGSFPEEFGYYNINAQPTLVFQGQRIMLGTSLQLLDSYLPTIQQFLKQTPEVFLEIKESNIEDKIITAQVELTFNDIDIQNLYLQYVVYKKGELPPYTFAGSGQLPTDVVRGRGHEKLIDTAPIMTIDFTVESVETIPESNDYYLVVWVQRMINTNAFSGNADKVLNVIKHKL